MKVEALFALFGGLFALPVNCLDWTEQGWPNPMFLPPNANANYNYLGFAANYQLLGPMLAGNQEFLRTRVQFPEDLSTFSESHNVLSTQRLQNMLFVLFLPPNDNANYSGFAAKYQLLDPMFSENQEFLKTRVVENWNFEKSKFRK